MVLGFIGKRMMDPKKMQELMQKMNIKTREIEAEQVIIRKGDGDIIIDNPSIMVVDMMGKDVYQITGVIKEAGKKARPKEEDIKLVMEQTGKDRDTVAKKLTELNSDLARAIIELKEEK